MADHTVPSESTHLEEEADANVQAGADAPPTAEESEAADRHPLDPATAEAEKAFNEMGAKVKGEGELP